jgi:crotonobetainyl-CoA:carnitine CoA-transferase CaiB-like acyl-CoA transferase
MSGTQSALDGVVVIDASRVLAGPYAGQILGDHGAEVIKVESFEGDDTRRYGQPVVDASAPYFLGLNRNKKNVALDLNSESGLETLLSLLASADVLIENFKLSTWRKWGITDLSTLAAKFPRLVHCRISGFGETGQMGGLPGYDAAIQAMSGLMSTNGDPSVNAARIGIPLVDAATGMQGALGVMLALYERERSNKGQMVEATLYDTAMSLLHPHAANVLYGGHAERTGNGHPNLVPYDLYQTATIPIFIAVGNDRQFATLCRHLGLQDVTEDERYATNVGRITDRERLTKRLSERLAEQDGMALFTTLMVAGVPCAPVLTVDEALKLPHTRDREMVLEKDGYRGVGIPLKLSRTPGSLRSTPPKIGQHNAEILARLGISQEHAQPTEIEVQTP